MSARAAHEAPMWRYMPTSMATFENWNVRVWQRGFEWGQLSPEAIFGTVLEKGNVVKTSQIMRFAHSAAFGTTF